MKATRANPPARTQGGLSYIELMLAAGLLAAVLVPAMETLQGDHMGTTESMDMDARHQHLAARMEDLLALPPAELAAAASEPAARLTPTSYSDPAGTPQRRLVYISQYDGDHTGSAGDPFSAGEVDERLLWLAVESEDRSRRLETLVTW